MKTNLSITSCLLGFLLTLACLQVSCFASSAEDSTHRILQQELKQKYGLVKEYIGADKSLRFLAEYKGPDTTFGNSKIIKNIETAISFHDKNTFRIKVYDHDEKRWEIPEKYPFAHFSSQESISPEESCCTVQVIKESYFAFVVTRKDTGEILFDSRNREFLFSDLYIELSTALPTDAVYGFGERNYKFKLSPGVYTIWGRDDPKIEEDGYGGGNTYSQHPVGLFKDKTGNFFLTLMRNSNAMDVVVENGPSLTYKMVGGIIDLLFFVGDSYPDTVLKSYHNYLGNFTMMPFWSMGFHQSKWGYTSHAQMEDVVNKYDSNNIPLDVIWSDIDYMIDKEIFTVNTRLYPLDKMRELTTKHKKKWVPIIDPGVRITNPQGPGYREGLNQGVFLKNYQGNILSGYVWPGRVYFPDMLNPNTEKWWGDMLEVLHKMIPFAGIWLDMNEVANFVDGEEHRPYSDSKYDQIPYTPGRNPLRRKTISLDAVHYGDVKEYDAHGIFSLLECQATHKFLESKSKLPFILTRSTSMGVGRFSAHWTGDNGATWQFLKESIAGNFNFQIFGIPFVGADICGFMDDTNEELCARWTQLGAWYPFARNHHEERTRHQEPWTFTGNNLGVTVLETVRIALKTRYSMLKWYYSLFVETGGAGSIFKPLYFEFPQEQELYKDGFSDWEFMLGKGVLCTPKVEQGEPFVEAYFPNATWFDLFKGHKFIDQGVAHRTKRVQTPFNAPVPMFLRAGHIVHRQKVDHVLATEDLNNEYELIVALEKDANSEFLTAKGSIMGIKTFDDDSVYDRCMQDNCLYDIAAKVNVEDLSSAIVEVSFKRQKRDAKVGLDSFGLYELKLFGLPLDFMEEDDVKEGYAILELVRDGKSARESLAQLTSIETNAFVISFEDLLEIQDGDVLKFELLI